MPHYPYWSVYDGLGQKYCDCSHEKYAITTLQLHEGERGINPAVERLHDDMRQQLEESKLAELDIEGEYQDWLY